jgi:hypothetical protein
MLSNENIAIFRLGNSIGVPQKKSICFVPLSGPMIALSRDCESKQKYRRPVGVGAHIACGG